MDALRRFWDRALDRYFGCRFWHDGPVIAQGSVEVTCKQNMPGGKITIPGLWAIRVCRRCHEVYATSGDRLN